MCDPLTIAALVGTVASTGLNMAGANAAQDAQADARRAEMERQQAYDAEMNALNEAGTERYDDTGKKTKGRSAKLSEMFTDRAAEIPTALTGAPAATGGVITQGQKASSKAVSADLTRRGDARADLRSFSDVLGRMGDRTGRDTSQLNMLGGFKRGSANLLPYELEEAASAGEGYQLLGDILGGVSSIGLNAGLSGTSLPGFGGTPVPPLPTPRPGMPMPVPRPGIAGPPRLPLPKPRPWGI